MQLPEVLAILAALRQEACDVWVGGSWGVDALVGRQTRAHRDLDLALNAAHEMRAVKLLEQRGYRIETDWRPVRVELVAPELGWVDVHPVVFDATGHGRQADLDGGHFAYPPETFTERWTAYRCRACRKSSSCDSTAAIHRGKPICTT